MINQFKILVQFLAGMWKQLGLNQRIIVVATGVVVIAGMVGIACWAGQTRYAVLYMNLAHDEVSTIQTTLEAKGIPTKLKPDGTTVMVPKEMVYEAKIFLAQKGLPKSGKDVIAFEIFDRPSIELSEMQKKVNHARAIQRELEKTIASIHGVEKVHVMVAMPETSDCVYNVSQASASVFIRTSDMVNFGKEQVRAIQFTVARGVEGLVPNRVSVTDHRGYLISDEQDWNLSRVHANAG